MSTSDVHAYLDDVLGEPGCLITYRLLSRRQPIHVGDAKRAMEEYYAKSRAGGKNIYATYWLSGVLATSHVNENHDAMDVDGQIDHNPAQSQVLIVEEDDLEGTKAAFSSVCSEHIYSLSTFKVQLCSGWREIRDCDKEGGSDLAKKVGKITSQDVKPIAVKREVESSAAKAAETSKIPEAKPIKVEETKAGSKQQIMGKKGPAKLDWSKAKSKSDAPSKEQPKSSIKKEEPSKPAAARGTKRKSSPLRSVPSLGSLSLQQDFASKVKGEPSQSQPRSTRVSKGVVISDDEDDAELSRRQGRSKPGVKARASDEDLRALMDVDDSEVIRASTSSTSKLKPTVETTPSPPGSQTTMATQDATSTQVQAEPEFMETDSDDPAPKSKPRKRKQKKVIPIGRNGLKKKRVIKSKTDFDEKGYMATVDYSSYESVDDEEPEEKPKPTAKKADVKPTAKPSFTSKSSGASAGSKKPEPKKGLDRSSSINKGKPGGANQKTLGSFFGGKSKA